MGNERMTGTVKWFNSAKGYGFLIAPDGEDCFIHHRSIDPQSDGYKTLREGEEVQFMRVRSEKGWQAAEVERLEAT